MGKQLYRYFKRQTEWDCKLDDLDMNKKGKTQRIIEYLLLLAQDNTIIRNGLIAIEVNIELSYNKWMQKVDKKGIQDETYIRWEMNYWLLKMVLTLFSRE